MRRFLTLTLDPRCCQPQESVAYARNCWRKFRTYLQRRHKNSISFIAIVELQKSGYAHLHILLDRYVEQAWLSEAWQAVGGGKIVFIKQVDVHRIAAYLSKYLTKDVLLVNFKPKQRRCTTSRDIQLFQKSEKGVWLLVKLPLDYLHLRAAVRVLSDQRDGDGILDWFETAEKIAA